MKNMEILAEAKQQDLLPLLKEYEAMIEILTSQVNFYANEQEHLRKEISILISENKALAQTVQELLDTYSSTPIKKLDQRNAEKELLENLKKQLSLTLQEKDTVVQLWQSALKNIDHLEEELKLFEGRTHGYFSKTEVTKIKDHYEKQITEIEHQLTQCHFKLESTIKESEKCLEDKKLDLTKALENRDDALVKVRQLESEITTLQNKLGNVITARRQLQDKLNLKNNGIEELKRKNAEAKAKITEAVQVVEAALREKDGALLREAKAKDEVEKISKKFSDVVEQSAMKAQNEIGRVQVECDAKLDAIKNEMRILQENLNTKNVALEKSMRECKLLEEELGRLRKGNIYIDESNTSKLLVLEKNLESTFQKLLTSEKRVLQLTAEKDCIKSDLEQMANFYKSDIESREIEKQVMKHEIGKLKTQLKSSKDSLVRTAGEVNKMSSKVQFLDADLQEKLQQKDIMCKQLLKSIREESQNNNVKVKEDLLKRLHMQVNHHKKWKMEVHDIINKLEKQLKRLKQVNKSLKHQLKLVLDKNQQYKKSFEQIYNRIVNAAEINKNVENAS